MRIKCWGRVFAVLAICILLLPPCEAVKQKPVTLPVVMYHQINPSPESWGDYTISPETFQGDLEYLSAKGYQTVTVQALIDYCQGRGELPEKPVLITFDDGYESFTPYALPALERLSMNAVVAVVGKYADTYTETEDHHLSYSYFSWPALAELQRSQAVELAVHTYDMHELGTRRGCKIKPGESSEAYSETLTADLERVERQFLAFTGETPPVFAYPYGFSCKEAKELLRKRGYQVLFTCEERVNALTGDLEELMNLGRFNRPNRADREQFFSAILP